MKRHIAIAVLATASSGWIGFGAGQARAQEGPAGETILQDSNALLTTGGVQEATAADVNQFISRGESEFKAGHYSSAVQLWRHALVDEPKNGGVGLMLSQALFAVGHYDEAAGAAQFGMSLLPAERWGTVVTRYKELYGNQQDYTDELRRLEKARDASPQAPAIRFLLAYHFGFLGYPKHAVKELDKLLELAPKDEMARKLIEQFKPLVKDEGAKQAPAPGKEDDSQSVGGETTTTPAPPEGKSS